MHIGNNHNSYIYGKGNVDASVDELGKIAEGKETLKYKYTGKVQNCQLWRTKTYLDRIISRKLHNDKNIKYRINKSFGNVNKINTTLCETLFGSFIFQAAEVMRN